MTIRLAGDAVLLEDVCAVEDAEILLQHLQAGAVCIDWSGCVHLHAACLQVLLVSGLPVRGTPESPALARWVVPMIATGAVQIARASFEATQNEV
jgi:hypothetical protein